MAPTQSSGGNWYGDYASFIFGSLPWFLRGANYSDGNLAGAFGFGLNAGNTYTYYSTRAVLSIID